MSGGQPPASRIRVHFFGKQAGRPVSPLAGALGVGPLPRPGGIEAQRFDRLAQTAPASFEVVSAGSTDLWLYAHDVGSPSEVQLQLDQLQSQTAHCVFFYSNDDAGPIAVARPNVSIFRTSLFARSRLAHESAMPALCDDLLACNGASFAERPWSDVPSIGFCGFVGSPLKRLGLQALRQREKTDGLVLRERALTALERGNEVRTRFIRRTSFWGGSMGRFHFDPNRQTEVRREFVRNLCETDYTLCVRGKGNFSYRFYEVLSAGRIPVFVNTDCVLPFEQRIDWRRHAVWLEDRELDSAAQQVARFHRALGPAGFRELQRENRRLWQEWLSPEGFFVRALETVRA
jgi:hypothetical protein